MAKFLLINLIALLLCVTIQLVASSGCPSPSKMYTCSPVCERDSDCASKGGKCCPNSCNKKSCAEPYLLSNGGGDKYGSKPNKYDTGSAYCGNTKCSPYEKCDSYKGKCVRA